MTTTINFSGKKYKIRYIEVKGTNRNESYTAAFFYTGTTKTLDQAKRAVIYFSSGFRDASIYLNPDKKIYVFMATVKPFEDELGKIYVGIAHCLPFNIFFEDVGREKATKRLIMAFADKKTQ